MFDRFTCGNAPVISRFVRCARNAGKNGAPPCEKKGIPAMKPILIPRTDLLLSPVGFGTAQAGRAYDGKDADRLFDAYVAGGGNLLDTAHVYSDWVAGERSRSERAIGDWIRRRGGHRDVVLMTKGGHPLPGQDMHTGRLFRHDMTADLNGSLQKLGVDCVDIYLYHRDDRTLPVEELVETMEDFVRQGKIRYYGCSNWKTDRMVAAETYCRAHGYRGFVVNQALYNIGTAAALPPADDTLVVCDGAMLAYHRHSDTLLMPYSSVANGYFHRLSANDKADGMYNTAENRALAARLFAFAAARGISLTAALLGFFAAADMPMLPLASSVEAEHLGEITEAMALDFSAADYAFVKDHQK